MDRQACGAVVPCGIKPEGQRTEPVCLQYDYLSHIERGDPKTALLLIMGIADAENSCALRIEPTVTQGNGEVPGHHNSSLAAF